MFETALIPVNLHQPVNSTIERRLEKWELGIPSLGHLYRDESDHRLFLI
jgi:hypothetical protein